MNAVPATRGVIQAVKESQSGKTLSVTVNGGYYTTKNWDFRDMVGQTIEFVPDVSEWQGNVIKWINDYAQPSPTAADVMAQTMAQNSGGSAQGGASAQSATQPPATPNRPMASDGDPMRYLPMTSNVVAHAIASGQIMNPEDIKPWATAAFAAAKSLIEAPQSSGTGEFDDDIPF